jgi:DNA helicase HerA-like ATPase
MIVWINGAFGAGKTTTARLVSRQLRDSVVVNPEKVGEMIHKVVPRHLRARDFQDEALWRHTVRELITMVDDRALGPVIVPMTVVRADVFDELVGGLRSDGRAVLHVTLAVDHAAVLRRIRRDLLTAPRERRYRRDRVDDCVSALAQMKFAPHIDGNQPRRQVARQLLDLLPAMG